MSLQFRDDTNYRGLVQIYEKEIGADLGFVTNNTTRLKNFTADCNLALDDFFTLAFKSDGRWQFDDSNHTDYPTITTNLVSGQRDYSFTSDELGNLILEVQKVAVANSSGQFSEIASVDVTTESGMGAFFDGQNASGTPTRYDKMANAIFLDPIPNYNYTNGLKVYINREASYFTYTDTTKKPGIPGLFHRYLAIKPAFDYARRNSSANSVALQNEILRIEQDIRSYFSLRNKDERKRMTVISDNR